MAAAVTGGLQQKTVGDAEMDATRGAKGPRPRSLTMNLPAGEAVASQSGLLGRVVMTSSRCRGTLPLARRRGADGVDDIVEKSHASHGGAWARVGVERVRVDERGVHNPVQDGVPPLARPCRPANSFVARRPRALPSGRCVQLWHALLPGRRGRHRDGNSGILQAGVYVSAAITCGRASHLKPQAKQASRSLGR